jgi:hypothetical protein
VPTLRESSWTQTLSVQRHTAIVCVQVREFFPEYVIFRLLRAFVTLVNVPNQALVGDEEFELPV